MPPTQAAVPAVSTLQRTALGSKRQRSGVHQVQRHAGAATAGAARTRPVTPEDLLEFQHVGDPQISPDGRRVVFTHKRVNAEKNEYVQNLWMVEVGDSSARAGAGAAAPGAFDPTPRPFTAGGKDRHPRWSPDGDRIAFISGRDKHRPQIAVIPASGGEAITLTKFPEGSIGTFKWSADGRTIAVSFREQDPQWTQGAMEERKKKGLSDPPRVLDDWWYRLDGDGYFNAQRHHLFLVDAATGEHRSVYAKDTMGMFSFDWSPDSRQIVIGTNRDPRAMVRPWKAELLRLDVASGKLTPIPNLAEGPKERVAWSPDGKTIAFAGRLGRRDGAYGTENLELFVCDPVKGGARSLTKDEDYCLMAVALSDTAEVDFGARLVWSNDSRRIFVQIGWHGEAHIASVAIGGGRLKFHTKGAAVHQMGNLARKANRMALTAGSFLKLDEVAIADANGDGEYAARSVTDLNAPLLRQLELAPIEEEWVTAADGHRVQIWHLKPRGYKAGRKYPAVLEVHGGPHAQYGVGFFHEFQALASAGYHVFFSNPRGSKGYGRAHCEAIRGCWGGPDWTDVQAVLIHMQGRPDVDKKKLGIMGGSYGGYMTNWAIGHTCDFAAAITDRCVSNLVSQFGNSDYTEEPDVYWPGNSWDKPEKMWECSPVKHLGNCRTPTLIIHSEGDLRCNIEQAEQVFTVLKLNEVPTRFVRYPSSTSHGMSRGGPPDLRIHRLHQILDWWKKYLG